MLACLCFYLLGDEVLNQNPKTQFHSISFEIVLACSRGSLGTISSTNIFGAIVGDVTEAYLPWVLFFQLILRGEQNQQIF